MTLSLQGGEKKGEKIGFFNIYKKEQEEKKQDFQSHASAELNYGAGVG